ncbi:MAG: DUF1501 domain-containing protein [Pirellulales bacterium]|nr:DUF1501 domain-containing protein [Pirellulales bacterium]
MLQIPFSSARSRRYCDGVSRRSFLQIGFTGLASLGLPAILRAQESAAGPTTVNKDTRVILFWLDGGPSHLDLYDMKPQAPSEYRGIWLPQKTNVPGFEISELLPEQAKVADKFSIIRSLYHDNGDHFAAAHAILTGRFGANGLETAPRNPYFGAAASKLIGPRTAGLPAHVGVPHAASVGLNPGYFGSSYLGPEHQPFTAGDPNPDGYQVPNLSVLPDVTIARLQDREHLRKSIDEMRRAADASANIAARESTGKSNPQAALDKFQQRAFDLVTSPAARAAFDIAAEPDAVRERYGRDTLGQSALLARRLVEAGVTVVSIHSGGWDHHWDIKPAYERMIPAVDRSFAALLEDLAQRGLWEKTLVLLCGEFSRTPKMNDGGNGGAPGSMGSPGRDHWGNAMFCLAGGGGVQGGRIIGATNSRGEHPIDRPVTPGDLHATIFQVLGIDPTINFLNHSGRPIPLIDSGSPIRELF